MATAAKAATAADAPPMSDSLSLADFAVRLEDEAVVVMAEVDEIELLINQAKTEAARHEARRVAANEKLQMAAERLNVGAGGTPKELAELANQLVAIGRKSALMEAQLDLLEGKRRSATRLADAITTHAAQARFLAGIGADSAGRAGSNGSSGARGGAGNGAGADLSVEDGAPMPLGMSRMILTAQEDMRREIARQMHDGPAQSLTNIVLQAQIVERLLARDPAKATPEVHALIAMVQRTLDATKTFIFDVRPMVLDDLGLVPTLRRASRDRGRRIGIAVHFESVGVDRRLPTEVETGLFRMLDDALAAHTASRPDTISLRLDWGDRLTIELTAGRRPVAVADPELPGEDAELPPTLADMVGERRKAYNEAVESARIASLSRLPAQAWRDVSSRARILGINAEMLDDGARLHLEVDLPPAPETLPVPAESAAG